MLTPFIASADESPPPDADASVHGTFNNGEDITLPRNLFQVRQRYERLPDAQGREPEKWVTTLRTDLWTGFGDGWKLYGRVDEPLVSFVAAVIGPLVRHARQPRRGLKYFAQRIKIIIVGKERKDAQAGFRLCRAKAITAAGTEFRILFSTRTRKYRSPGSQVETRPERL